MNKKHKIIIVLIVVLFIGGLSVYLFTNKNSLDGKVVKKSSINLNNYKDNIILKKGGEYTLTGEFEHSVLIDSSEKVILNLNNVDIENKVNTAIANINNNQLVINILENTKNELSSRGESEYDGCIFSNGEIIINGPGSLKIRGRQKEGEGITTKSSSITINGGEINIDASDDGINTGGEGGTITINDSNIYINANGDGIDSNKDVIINGGILYSIGSTSGNDCGIDTETGYTINGGTVISTGSTMMKPPLENSKQNVLYFRFEKRKIDRNILSLVNDKNENIISFLLENEFDVLLISTDKLENGQYYLYENGKNHSELINGIYSQGSSKLGNKISINNNDLFKVSSNITQIMKNR